MSTITPIEPISMPANSPASAGGPSSNGGEQRTVFRGVDWHTYEQLSNAIGEGQQVRLIFDGKDLEIMVTGNIHERYKVLLGRIVDAVIMGLDVDNLGCGQTTWKTVSRGLEADLSYYFDPAKIRVAKEAISRMSMEPGDYPRPDLAIEIEMSAPQVDRRAIYKELGVAEVWRLVRGRELIIEQLQADGSYAPIDRSRYLRIGAEDVVRWLNEEANERAAAWNRRLNLWAMGLGNPQS